MTIRARSCAGMLSLLLAGAAPAAGQPLAPQAMVDAATTIVGHIKADDRYAKELRTARAVIIIPDAGPAAQPGGRTQAILVKHDSDGLWSPPVFMTLGPLAVAAPGGGHTGEGALMLMTGRALDDVLRPHFTFSLADNLAVATFVAKQDQPLGEGDVDIWSGPSGALTGVTLVGAAFAADSAMNRRYYGRPVQSRDILAGRFRNPGDKRLRKALPL